ncbi:GL19779 [Drosophila persimilis]|uniref:GL19779 n=1 Tax=Drosophila persimilis TaxID=7234 RepID=B4IRA8_DROPE|nr:GL19779 [Drosophila persimilis]
MEIPTTKYLADYLYVVHEDVPFRYYRKVSAAGRKEGSLAAAAVWVLGCWVGRGGVGGGCGVSVHHA